MKFLEDIKKSIRPDNSVLKIVDDFISDINKTIKDKKIKAECVAGGSVAKGTFLKGDFDVDLFVRFDYSYKDQNISDLLELVLKKFKITRVHGSRDYFQLKKDKLNFEIVPVLKVSDPAKALNVTDMSVLHVDWVKNNIKNKHDEIRLTKKFCKSIGVYGAESYISGFSGHIIDILVINYGSFLELLKASLKWKPQVIIDINKYYKKKQDILFNLNQSKIKGPMIIIDPILKTRNAASALSYEKFSNFKKKAKEFLKKPSKDYFIEKKIGKTFLKNKYKKNLYILTLKSKKGKKDVVGSKILKAFKFLKSELNKLGFEIKTAGWSWNEKQRVLFWFVVKNSMLPEERIVEGPPLEMTDHVLSFKQKYSKCFNKNNKIYAKEKIKLRHFKDNVNLITKQKYFKDKNVSLIKIE